MESLVLRVLNIGVGLQDLIHELRAVVYNPTTLSNLAHQLVCWANAQVAIGSNPI
jgi:hypothetical protein